ncbi:MAG: hypothetical protein H7Z17_11135 [Fuerstia sp.]|nr:hypothetical protein [Fuerstiella sp.]
MIHEALFGKFADRNASRRSDVAYVAQSLRRLRFTDTSVAMPPEIVYDATPLAGLLFVVGEQDSLFARQRNFAELKFCFGLA